MEFQSVDKKRRIASRRRSNNDFPPQLSDDNDNDVYDDNACAEQRWRVVHV